MSDPVADCEPTGRAYCGGVDVTFDNTVISTLFLPVGTYALNQFVEVDGSASGGSFLTVSFQSDSTPTPEPRGHAVLLGVALVALHRRQIWVIDLGPHYQDTTSHCGLPQKRVTLTNVGAIIEAIAGLIKLIDTCRVCKACGR